ncbi:MAG: hypothetical protein ACJAXA_000070 [Candidatus Aldehydirespiratoraceae bacterium]
MSIFHSYTTYFSEGVTVDLSLIEAEREPLARRANAPLDSSPVVVGSVVAAVGGLSSGTHRTLGVIQHLGDSVATSDRVRGILAGDDMESNAVGDAQQAVREMLDASDTLLAKVDLAIIVDGDAFTLTVRGADGGIGRVQLWRNVAVRADVEAPV